MTDRINPVILSRYGPGVGSVRNPEFELICPGCVKQHSDLAVICGHELTGELNSLKRAATVLLNVRLIPVIRELIISLQGVLRKRGIDTPLIIVEGDGSLVSCEFAFERPVETILSGPAASADIRTSCIGGDSQIDRTREGTRKIGSRG